MKKRTQMTKQDQAKEKLELELDMLNARLTWHRRLIKDAWWILTDIQEHQLNAEPHIQAVVMMLSDIAVDYMDGEK